MNKWNDADFIAFDFETSGMLPEYALQPWRVRQGTAWATSLAVVQKREKKLVTIGGGLATTVDDMRAMLERAIENNQTIVGWNTVFDISWLIAYGLRDLVMQARWLDGMLLWRHLTIEPEYETDRSKKKSYSLKTAVTEYLPRFAGYEEGVDFHDASPEARAKLHKYNVRDTVFTLILAKHFYNLLEPAQLRAALIEAETLPLVALANFEGMVIDTLAARELSANLAAAAQDKLERLQWCGVTEKIVRSPMQLAKLMFDDWGLTPLKENIGKKTGKVSRATDKETLHELSFVDARAKELRLYREALNNRTKFAEAPLASVAYNQDGRSRPQAIVFGTYSGRLTYASKQGLNKNERQTGFALHQEKRGAEFRGIVIPPPGYTLMEFDASGQEFRWMAIASGDPVMLNLCGPGEDAHSYMGAAIASISYEKMLQDVEQKHPKAKDRRQLGKVANLCLAAGTIILTDRGPCCIEHILADDLVWDGVEFVAHDGVVCSGYRSVIAYDGVIATPEHKVLIDGRWVEIQAAARHGWRIESALGARGARVAGAAFRIVGGLIRRAVSEIRRAICKGAMRMWCGEGCQPARSGDGAIHAVQVMRGDCASQKAWPNDLRDRRGQEAAKASERVVPAMHQPERQGVSQLRRTWHQMRFYLGARGSGVDQGISTAPNISEAGHRSCRQRWALRTWKFALGYTKTEPREPHKAWVYDIVNCGPRHQFSANGKIVHNSLQYRTSAPKLRVVARVQYGLPMNLDEAQLIRRTYLTSYRRVPMYWERQIAATKRLGYVETFAGRRVQVVGDWARDGWAMGSTAINYRIQGTGADQKYLALMVLKPLLIELGARFAWDLHDGIYLYVPDRNVPRAAVEIKRTLDTLPYQQAWGFTPPVPLPWDCKAGTSWGNLQEWKDG